MYNFFTIFKKYVMLKPKFYIIAFIFLIFFLFEFLFIQVIPTKLNLNNYIPSIQKYLEENIHIQTDIGQVKFDTFSDFSVNFKTDFIKVYENNEILLDAQNLNLRLYLLPLLLKKLHIRTLSADNLSIVLERDKNGQYNFSNFVLDNSVKNFDLKISDSHLFLNNYNILFKDNYYKNIYKINGNYFFINRFVQDKLIDFSAIGNLYINNDKPIPFKFDIKTKLPLNKYICDKDFKIEILLPFFNLKYLNDYLKEYADKTLIDLSGVISVDIKTKNENIKNKINSFISLSNVIYKRKKDEFSVNARGKHTIDGDFILANNAISIETLKIISDLLDIEIQGKLANILDTEKVKTDLNIKINTAKSDAIYWLLPSEIPLGLQLIPIAKKYGFYANVKGEIQAKGVGLKPNLFGKIKLSDTFVVKEFASHVPKASINLDFKGDYLTVDARAFTDKKEYVDVAGDIKLYPPRNVDLTIKSTPKIDLLYAYQVLIPLYQALDFQLGPVPAMKFYDGFGNIDLIVKGNKFNPDLFGYFECYKTSASLNGLNALLNNTSARMDFKHNTYHFETIEAFERNLPIKVVGDGDWTGKLDFDIIAQNFEAKEGFNILSKSILFNEFKKYFNMINDVWGKVDFNVNIKGILKEFDLTKITDELKYEAEVKFINIGSKSLNNGIIITDLNGDVLLEENDFIVKLKGLLNNSPFNFNANSDFKNINLNTNFNNLNLYNFINKELLGDIATMFPTFVTKANTEISYNAPIDKFYPNKLNATIKFNEINKNNLSVLKIENGIINFKNGILNVNNIIINCYSSYINLNGKIENILNSNYKTNLNVNTESLEISDISRLLLSTHNNDLKKLGQFLKQVSAKIVGNLEFSNNKLNGKLDINNVIFKHEYLSQVIVLGNLKAVLQNNNLHINPFTFNFCQVPTFIKIKINSILKNPDFDIYLSSKIIPEFLDNFLNHYLTYPLKMKGESIFSTTIRGTLNNLESYASLKIPAFSDISYMGVNLGDVYDDRELYLNAVFSPEKIIFKNAYYKKYIKTQNNRIKPLHILGIDGTLIKNKNTFNLAPLNVKTYTPASAKFFNLIFKKSVIKNGLFDCDLKVSGDILKPVVEGKLKLSNVEMPMYDAVIRDLDIDFSKLFVDIMARIKAWGSEAELNALVKNSLIYPIEIFNIDIFSNFINLDNLEKELTQIKYSSHSTKNSNELNELLENVPTQNIIIKAGKIRAKDVLLRNLNAQNLDVDFSLNNKSILNINKVIFELVDGIIQGNLVYNFKNTNLSAKMSAKNVSANPVVKALLGLDGQIYGSMNGSIDVKTCGYNDEERLRNLSGDVSFDLVKGKMPKLGSLEYLLRAANLFKSGLTGLTINGIIQLIIPMETGAFKDMRGELTLDNGSAKNIQIYTQGEDLNLYLVGNIDLLTTIAKIEVWGAINKDGQAPLGVIGNASLNSVFGLIPWLHLDSTNKGFINYFNKIPGIELSTEKTRVFRALINGDISTEKFVEKFEWVKN